ncbi:hypothetical protein [Planctomyces sp. SH-PL62]|uniref:hypothetical protein n=1 Tax=Planctomyces sp. SH-PL62 TaxID=1636152 RepID=UPI0012E89D99|nr:hypothetical protein [Planctomyces sp. SH-PL62]
MNDVTASQLAAGGWNLGWTKRAEDLDIYDRHGLRAVLEIGMPDLDDPAQAEALDALIVKVRDHPALYSYYLADEPGAGAFAKLGKIISWIRRRDPAHMAFICLLPTYASDGQLQVSDDVAERARVGYPQDFAGVNTSDLTAVRYRDHLRQFVDVVRPDLISYDHYHFQHSGDGTQYFLNLALIRSTALAADVPFLNVIQACESTGEGLRLPDEQELRWLTYTSLAYGAQGLAHFRYDTGFWKDPRETSVPLPRFWAVSQLNREFVAVATELQPLRSLGAYHSEKAPLGGEPLPAGSAFTPEPSSRDWLLGYFGSSVGTPTHVLVVNLNYKARTRVALNGPGDMEAFHAPTVVWRPLPGGDRIELDLPPGGGVLVRLNR